MANYVFFWGHTPKQQGVIDKSCLSQWYPTLIFYEVNTNKVNTNKVDSTDLATAGYCFIFQNAEQFMMYKKACLFKDYATMKEILRTPDPKKAKALGRKVKGFDQKVWDENKEKIVYQANFLKFSQNEDLRKFLLSFPDDAEFVEASPYDKVWGIGMRANDPRAQDKSQWLGENLLGKALTKTRQRLKAIEEFEANLKINTPKGK